MKTYNRGIRLSKLSKEELQAKLEDARKKLSELESYQLPDRRMEHLPPWYIHKQRNLFSRISRIRAAMKIQSDRAYEEMVAPHR